MSGAHVPKCLRERTAKENRPIQAVPHPERYVSAVRRERAGSFTLLAACIHFFSVSFSFCTVRMRSNRTARRRRRPPRIDVSSILLLAGQQSPRGKSEPLFWEAFGGVNPALSRVGQSLVLSRPFRANRRALLVETRSKNLQLDQSPPLGYSVVAGSGDQAVGPSTHPPELQLIGPSY